MFRWLNILSRHTDVLVAIGIITILAVMIVPLPTYVLDFLLTLNISIALLVLMLTIYITAPLELSVFPGLLLVMTLFRLSLNVASTRLILSEADAGRLIQAFGDVVVRGNYVLGFIIFVIVILIQFLVITKGTGRVAEVAARFTLDAMPGKQMAIDADLNAGLIDEQQATLRREEISREADFYGNMDGASKFVRGDAIAGILITLINIIGGFAIGVFQRDLSLAQALETYTLLTVGDGLVTQIPALITSTAAGIIVTRATGDNNMGTDINKQLTGKPQAGLIAGVMLVGLGLIPGLPTWPFIAIGFVLIAISLVVRQQKQQAQTEIELNNESQEYEERPEDYLRLDQLEVQVGYQLVPLVDANQGGELIERIVQIRKVAAMEMGFVAPPVRVRDSTELQPSEYHIRVKGNSVASGDLRTKELLAIDPGSAEGTIEGGEAIDPVFGLPAKWILPSQREQAELLGYNVVEPVAILATHLTEVVNSHAHELLGRHETQNLIDELKQSYPNVVEELLPDSEAVGKLQRVLQILLAERVPIKDLRSILEVLSEYSQINDVEVLSEYVRTALRRSICNMLLKDSVDQSISALTIDGNLENVMAESVQSTPSGIMVALDQGITSEIFGVLTSLIDDMVANGQQPTVLASPQIRLAFRKLTVANFPTLHIISYNEIAPDVDITSVGTIALDEYENTEIHSSEYAGGAPASSR
ncbi:MAG: flagellar biosynthesis protein FlhA [Candidatus Latescibacterota bacterium]|nr:flagellar biosynthesis protein FlhA [Candidatus Latescibacterota bacterium]